ncbi:MAG: hemerythrin domain-containing protein [Rhodocyclales bacterium]|jgi:iron-sulfur cluster repair protein YtfE (RIC family)|nr:hemerythrin domain-containing protein [Rhodocyclales bacterium]MBI5784133.1 hemerythrin domain-containing protein [Rhodocyclales bacterium]
MSTTQALPEHHKNCDLLFARAEESAMAARWPECEEAFGRFRAEIGAHFETEEQVLFPAFEAATGSRLGPTQMMRLEHAQMNTLLGQIGQAVAARDADGFAGAAETLLILMQQHNMKEENILYPMCDQALAGQTLAIGDEIARRAAAPCPT